MALALLCALLACASCAAAPLSPSPLPRTVRVGQSVRFSVYADAVLRLEWSRDGTFDDLPSMTVVNRAPAVPHYTRTVGPGGVVTLKTALVTLVFDPAAEAADIGRAPCAVLNVREHRHAGRRRRAHDDVVPLDGPGAALAGQPERQPRDG